MTSINSDQMSSMVLASLNKSNSEMKIAMERLSTGKRINAAGDDAAGLSISSKLRAQVDSLNAAIKNSSDALAMVSTMDGEGFGGCTNIGECEAACPKNISLDVIAHLNRDYAIAQAKSFFKPSA